MTAKFLVATGVLASTAGGVAAAAQNGTAMATAGGTSISAIVGGIISYSRWPRQQRELRICIAGNARFATQVGHTQGQTGQVIAATRVAPTADPAGCDVLYLGQMPGPVQQRLLSFAQGKAILTIAEYDPACRSGAMVCLLPDEKPVTFRLNLDAVARSQVRVDPRVLRIAGDQQ